MKKSKFLVALACFGLLVTGCNKPAASNESKPASASGASQQPSSNKPVSSTPASSAPVVEDKHYDLPFGDENSALNGSDGKWGKGAEYKWTFTLTKNYKKVVFAVGAQMSSSSHGDRSLYTNHEGASNSDSFESNEANDGTCRVTFKVNGKEVEVTHDTYETAGLTTSEFNYFKLAEFYANAGTVEVSLKTNASTGYRLLLGEGARLYYKDEDESATPIEPEFEGYKVNFVAEHCKVYVYDTKDYTKTPVETNSCVAKDEEGKVVAYDPADEHLQPQVNFKVVCDEGYTLNASNFTITGTYNKLKQGESVADGLPDAEHFRITKVQTDLTVNIAPVQGQQAKGYKISFVPTHCTIKVYVGPKNTEGTNLDEAEEGYYYARSKDEPYGYTFADPQINFEVVCEENYEFKPTITSDKVDFIAFEAAEGKVGYNKFKDNSNNLYNLTKIDSDLTITITATEAIPEPPVEGTKITKTVVSICGATTADGTQFGSLALDEVITASVNTDGNNGKVYSEGTEWRLYQGDSAVVTIAAVSGYQISSVKLTFTNKNSGAIFYGTAALVSDTAQAIDPAAASVELTVGNSGTATNGQIRIKAFEIVYNAIAA